MTIIMTMAHGASAPTTCQPQSSNQSVAATSRVNQRETFVGLRCLDNVLPTGLVMGAACGGLSRSVRIRRLALAALA